MAFSKAKALLEAEKSVSQGKVAQAIKLYLDILDNDSTDLTLLNTVGDLYIRERNIPEGLRQFNRLAEAYVREGFNVKAIAIYRKITKLDANNVETLLKLAELYQLQGLGREAREQYLQAAESFKKRNQPERTVEVLRKLVQLDPENATLRNRLAAEYEQAGKRPAAAVVFLEFAEACIARGDPATAEPALKKAADLDPKNSRVRLLWARSALGRQQPEEAEKILADSPEVAGTPEGKQILLEAYFAAGKHSEAEKLVLEVYRANPGDFTPVLNFVSLSLEKATVDAAFQPLAQLADESIQHGNAAHLLDALRKLWNKAPAHLPTLELIYRVCDQTADEFSLPEILEALGHAYVQAEQLEKAEDTYRKLIRREPENQHYRGLLRQVQQKLNKTGPAVAEPEIAAAEPAAPPEGERAADAGAADAEQTTMVKEAIENSDLFARYHLVDKAVAELDKVLQIYPDQIDILKRVVEISRQGLPLRAASAAADLVRICTAQGDEAAVKKYQALLAKTAETAPPAETPPAAPPSEAPPAAPLSAAPSPADTPVAPEVLAAIPAPAAPAPISLDQIPGLAEALSAPDQPDGAPPAPTGSAPPPAAMDFDIVPPAAKEESDLELTLPAPPPPESAPPDLEIEFDLSGDLEAMTAPTLEAPEPPPGVPAETAVSEAEPSPPMSGPDAVSAEAPVWDVGEESAPEAAAQGAGPIVREETSPSPAPVDESGAAEVPLEPLPEAPLVPPSWLTSEPEATPAAPEMVAAPDAASPAEAEVTEPIAEQPVGLPDLAPAVSDAEPSPEISEPAAISEGEAAPFNFEETELEINFYLEHGFFEEARQAVAALEEKYPGNELVADLRLRVEETSEPVAPPERADVEAADAAPEIVADEPVETAPVSSPDDWELPSTYAETSSPAASGSTAAGEFTFDLPPAGEGRGADILGDLTAELSAPLRDVLTPPAEKEPPVRPPALAPGAAELSGLLDELDEPGFGQIPAEDDPETHYNLGVAFREMGLLEEAIGEFQKVVRGAGKGLYPPNFLQACSLLAICFMDKKMPTVAIKWYLRALESPTLEEEAVLALQYDLGVAYEQVGDSQSALERFTEVYSQNIDFRDVAEKIRVLQQKV